MSTIWKFQIDNIGQPVEIDMPVGAKVLSCQPQGQLPTIWALVDPAAKTEIRRFIVVGTGWDLRDDLWEHIETFQVGPFVWHAFEIAR